MGQPEAVQLFEAYARCSKAYPFALSRKPLGNAALARIRVRSTPILPTQVSRATAPGEPALLEPVVDQVKKMTVINDRGAATGARSHSSRCYKVRLFFDY